MANIITELTNNNSISVTFLGRQGAHVRSIDGWIDWMLQMDDFRDLIIPLSNLDVDFIITELLNRRNRLTFSNTELGQEFIISNAKKIVRRAAPGRDRDEYQSVAIFLRNADNRWPPEPFEITRRDILLLIRAMITLNRPANYHIIDSIRNYQYLLAIMWIKKKNPRLLNGQKKPNAREIFRTSLI
jgi:hypothetical protein